MQTNYTVTVLGYILLQAFIFAIGVFGGMLVDPLLFFIAVMPVHTAWAINSLKKNPQLLLVTLRKTTMINSVITIVLGIYIISNLGPAPYSKRMWGTACAGWGCVVSGILCTIYYWLFDFMIADHD